MDRIARPSEAMNRFTQPPLVAQVAHHSKLPSNKKMCHSIAGLISKLWFVCYTLAYCGVFVIRGFLLASSCSKNFKETRCGVAESDSHLLCCPSQPPSGTQWSRPVFSHKLISTVRPLILASTESSFKAQLTWPWQPPPPRCCRWCRQKSWCSSSRAHSPCLRRRGWERREALRRTR